MTVAGLPGLPGGKALVPALDAFTRSAFQHARQDSTELCGVFLWAPEACNVQKSDVGPDEIEWKGRIEWVECLNVADNPTEAFELDSQEVEFHIMHRLEHMFSIANIIADRSDAKVNATSMLLHAYSPFVGIGHSHPGGTPQPSAADFLASANAASWRRATAPGTLLNFPEEARFFEAEFLIAIEDQLRGNGTLVHFRRGRTEGTWKGNFLPAVD